MPHAKHDQVRGRYGARCGYCGVAENEAGGELSVDHYVPVGAGGDDSDDNLIYACFRCNFFKGDFNPTPEDRAKGRVLLHPLRDDASKHLRFDETTGQLEPLTETGRFHVAVLRLNRPPLIALRLRRRYHELLLERMTLVEAENRELRASVRAQDEYISHLERHVEGQEPE